MNILNHRDVRESTCCSTCSSRTSRRDVRGRRAATSAKTRAAARVLRGRRATPSVDVVPPWGREEIQDRMSRGGTVPQHKHVPKKAGGKQRDPSHSGARRLDKVMF